MADPFTLTRRRFMSGVSGASVLSLAGPWSASASTTLPANIDPSRGTVLAEICRPDGRTVKRAYSWSPTGYALVEDGVVIEQVGTP